MQRSIIISIILILVFIFVILYFSDYISPFMDLRYILLIAVIFLGLLSISFGVFIFSEQSLGDNIIDTLINFGISGVFSIVFGGFLIIIAILGLVFGPDWLGMEAYKILL
ncbi:hypothetical protein RH915_03205 [Serpentinicella sp. ANB-PHB4]|uniref:hypothetical protein n=1 Tax=Serpentinicella sp. ANB-PHB4 TaxID=3074076 RepID=UPI00285E811B|nr:hypothetical protein [Serpentinicella sp. ANB-PHB4]MDR5658490.1 hypothetical protein [Serpentinicella sp. ANB-PHB4]